MRNALGLVLFAGTVSLGLLGQRPLLAQACQDEETMVSDYKKSIADLTATVKKESLEDFQKAYHRKSCLTKLTLCVSILGGVIDCFSRAAQDPVATKAQAGAYKAKGDGYSKLRDKVGQYRDALKAAAADKDAKPIIEKIDM